MGVGRKIARVMDRDRLPLAKLVVGPRHLAAGDGLGLQRSRWDPRADDQLIGRGSGVLRDRDAIEAQVLAETPQPFVERPMRRGAREVDEGRRQAGEHFLEPEPCGKGLGGLPALLDHSRQAHQRDRHSAEKDLKREYGLRGPLRHEDPALARAGDDRQQRRRDEADAESARPEADRRPEEERQQDRDRSGQLRRQPQPELRRISELTHTRQEEPAGEQARLEIAARSRCAEIRQPVAYGHDDCRHDRERREDVGEEAGAPDE